MNVNNRKERNDSRGDKMRRGENTEWDWSHKLFVCHLKILIHNLITSTSNVFNVVLVTIGRSRSEEKSQEEKTGDKRNRAFACVNSYDFMLHASVPFLALTTPLFP